VTFVDPSRNPLHDEASGLYHGDVPVDPGVGPILRPADDPEAFAADRSADMAAATYDPSTADGGEPNVGVDPDGEAYQDMTVEQLRPIARERGIAFSNLKKDELVDALYDWDDEHAETVDDTTAPADGTTGPAELTADPEA
jgi:hypothetical protein